MNEFSWLAAVNAYLAGIRDIWPGKAAAGAAIAAACAFAGIDLALFYLLCATLAGESLARMGACLKRRKGLCRAFVHIVQRHVGHGAAIIIACVLQVVNDRTIGLPIIFPDYMAAILILSDLSHVFGHLQILGVPMPPLARELVLGGHKRIERAARVITRGEPRHGEKNGLEN